MVPAAVVSCASDMLTSLIRHSPLLVPHTSSVSQFAASAPTTSLSPYSALPARITSTTSAGWASITAR